MQYTTTQEPHIKWIDEQTKALSLFLKSYISTPAEGSLNTNDITNISKVIRFTTQYGTPDQQGALYLLLLSTRCILGKRGHETLRTPIAQLTELFQQQRPDVASEIDTAILSTRAGVY